MVRQYRSRVGQAIAADTKTQLTGLGSEAAPGPLLVPVGTSRLVKAIVVAMTDWTATNDCGAIVRLEGPGLPGGPEVVVAGAFGAESSKGAYFAKNAEEIPLDVPVTPGNEILIFGEIVGELIGDTSIGVTLVFE